MKRLFFLLIVFSLASIALYGQYEKDPEKGFKKENLFTGGSLTVSFFNGQTILGANPMFGYKLTEWADAGLAINYVYTGSRDYYVFDDKIRQTVWGPGAFARIYPVKFLFLQGQFEHNFNTFKYIPPGGSPEQKDKVEANSLLVGGGIAQGRERGSTTFFYFSVLVDVLKNVNSPYVNVSYNPDNPAQQHVSMIPILRAGVNIGLFQGRYRE